MAAFDNGKENLMNNPKIAIILGTTRATRFADRPSKWLLEIASRRSDLSFEILDLRDFPLRFSGPLNRICG